MKIHIELELQADEVPLATELLNTLRALTDHVKVISHGNGTHPDNQHSAQHLEHIPAQPTGIGITPVAPALQPAHHLHQAPAPSQQLTSLQQPRQPQFAPQHVSTSPLPKGASCQAFEALLIQLVDESQLERVSAEFITLLAQPQRLAMGPNDLLEVYEAVVLNPQLVLQNQSVVPFISLLPRLPDPYKNRVRDGLIAKVLQHLTKKRPVTVDRTQFFVHAEAFAMLVKIGFVSVDGAAQTIEKLLHKADSRAAAVTMLGKTVEMCSDKLLTKCNKGFLHNLWKSLEKVTEETFKYDVDWITQYMGWPSATQRGGAAGAVPGTSAAAPAPVAPATAPHTLTALTSFQGHDETIFTMCFDPVHRHLISGGKDGKVIVWNPNGVAAHKVDIPSHYVCSMDVHPRSNILLVCGVATEHAGVPSPPCILAYDTNLNWQPRGVLSRPHSTLISCVRCMGAESDGFVTGETANGPDGLQELVCYYDMARSASWGSLQPVHSYNEHDNLVTCVATHPGNPNLLVSGSRDQTIRMWDKRSDRSVGMFGSVTGGVGDTFKITAHGEMITCLDTLDNLLLSTGVDGYLCFWDLRSIGGGNNQTAGPIAQMQVDSQPILKVALTGAPAPNIAAVSTFQGVYVVDFSNINSPQRFSAHLSDGQPFKVYHDVKWGAGQLYAANENPSIDVFGISS